MSTDINDIWQSLQEVENKNKKEYNNKINSKKKINNKLQLSNEISKNKTKPNNAIESNKQIVYNENKPKDIVQITSEEMQSKINRYIDGLNNETKIKRQSLEKLSTILFESYTMTEVDYSIVFRDICKSLFRLLSDNIEKIRELAINISIKFIERIIDIIPILNYLFTSLMQRIPSGIGYDEEMKIFVIDSKAHDEYKRGKAVNRQDKPIVIGNTITISDIETSEEIRLKLCQLILTLITRCKSLDTLTLLQPYFTEIIMFIQIQLRDSYPDVRIKSCEVINQLCHISEYELGMKYYCIALIRALLPSLRHRHAKVRAVTISTILNCIIIPDRDKYRCAGGEAIVDIIGFQEENVLSVSSFYQPTISINYLAELVNDNSSTVREKLVEIIDVLLCDIPDRLDHTTRLLPYLLDLLTDDISSISKIAMKCLEKCGKLYENEHKNELIEKIQYNVLEADHRINTLKPFPYPFTTRPSYNIRCFMKGYCKRFIYALINELTHWQIVIRLKSLKLLNVVIILSEESLTIESFHIIPNTIKVLYSYIYEIKDKVEVSLLYNTIELLGRYIHPEIYLHYILPRLTNDNEVIGSNIVTSINTFDNKQYVYLIYLQYILTGSRINELFPYLINLSTILTDYTIIQLYHKNHEIVCDIFIYILDEINNYTSKTNLTIDLTSFYINSYKFFIFYYKLKSLTNHLTNYLSIDLKNYLTTQLSIDLSTKSSNGLTILSAILSNQLATTSTNQNLHVLYEKFGTIVINEFLSSYKSNSVYVNDFVITNNIINSDYFNIYRHIDLLYLYIGFLCDLINSQIDIDIDNKINTSLSTLIELFIQFDYKIDSYIDDEKKSIYEDNNIDSNINDMLDSKVNRQIFNQKFDLIIKTYLIDNEWNQLSDYLPKRLQLLSFILGLKDISTTISVLTYSYSDMKIDYYNVSTEILIVLSKYIPNLLNQCKAPSNHELTRNLTTICIYKLISTVNYINKINDCIVKPHSVSYFHELINELLVICIQLCSDSSETIQSNAIQCISIGIYYINDSKSFNSISKYLIELILLNFDNKIGSVIDNQIFNELDTCIHRLVAVNTERFIEIINDYITTYSTINHNEIVNYLNDLLDHCQLVTKLVDK